MDDDRGGMIVERIDRSGEWSIRWMMIDPPSIYRASRQRPAGARGLYRSTGARVEGSSPRDRGTEGYGDVIIMLRLRQTDDQRAPGPELAGWRKRL
jgi:hypothetical protein